MTLVCFRFYLPLNVCSQLGRVRNNVPPLGEVANFGTDYFLLKIKILAKRKCEYKQNSQSCQTAGVI